MGNAIIKRGEASLPVVTVGSKNNLVVGRNHSIAMVDVDDLIVVDTTDSILIAKKGSSQRLSR
jgi:mannose-1-phosphate guanylyltransferase